MCYNVKVELTAAELIDRFHLPDADAWPGPAKHIGLGKNLPAITQSGDARVLELMYFGFTPYWTKDPKGGMKPGNARAETVATTPMFRDAFKRRRCLVPVTAFYEWIGEKGSKQLLPLRLADRDIFALAGVWDEWRKPDGESRRSLAILTSEPNEEVSRYHNRMPVILEENDDALWLSPDAPPGELASVMLPFRPGAIVADVEAAFKPGRGV